MVERLLVLLVEMAAVMLGMSAETQLDVQSNRSFINVMSQWASKGQHQINLIPQIFLRCAHAPEGCRYSFLRQIEEGSVVRLGEDPSPKSSQDIPQLGLSPGVLNPSCLQLLRCQNANTFNFDSMEIHHADLPERSAAACGHLCLRQRPSASLVMAKLSSINEQLVCGCGDYEALPSLTMSDVPSRCLQPCPDGKDSCGGPSVVSVYQVDSGRKDCVALTYSYYGCYNGKVGAATLTLGPWERWAGGCMARCRELNKSGTLMGLATTYDGTTRCDCG